jgi:hypothetical protein
MKFRGKDIEIIGEKLVFGKRTAWVRLVEDNSFQQNIIKVRVDG